MPAITFKHDKIPETLTIDTGANEISWGYNLNIESYPTYAGEVVQVLSSNIDDLQITGEIKSYAKMEEIYTWFLKYMLRATQGYQGNERYDESPVTMTYDHRGWQLAIKPIALPAMRYGRDVIIPQWQLRAAIVDPDPDMAELAIDKAVGSPVSGDLENFRGRISADVGYRHANPFSDPIGVITEEENALYPGAKDIIGLRVQNSKKNVDPDFEEQLDGLGKQMNDMFMALLQGEFKSLYDADDISKPATGNKKNDARDDDTADTEKIGNVKIPPRFQADPKPNG